MVKSKTSGRTLAAIICFAMIFSLLPAKVNAANSETKKMEIDGIGTVYYVVDPQDSENDHAHIDVEGEEKEAEWLGGNQTSKIAYYLSSAAFSNRNDLNETMYGSASMTWLEYWKNEGLTASTVTDKSSPEYDAHDEHDLGGFDAITRGTVKFGISHCGHQCYNIFNGVDSEYNEESYPVVFDKGLELSEKSKVTSITDNYTSFNAINGDNEKEYKLLSYTITGFARIPISVNGLVYVENMIKHDVGKAAPESFKNVTIGGKDGAWNDVTSTTGGLKVMNAKGEYGKAAPGNNTHGYEVESRGGTDAVRYDYNYTWGDYVDAHVYIQKKGVGTTEGATTLSSNEYKDYSENFIAAKYEYYGTLDEIQQADPSIKLVNTPDDVKGLTPKATYGTNHNADTWYGPSKKQGGRIECGFNFDSIRIGGNGKNTDKNGIYNYDNSRDKLGYYKVTIRAAGYNDIERMVHIKNQIPAPKLAFSNDMTKLKLSDINNDLKAALAAEGTTIELFEVSDTETTKVATFNKLKSDNTFDIALGVIDKDYSYKLVITGNDSAEFKPVEAKVTPVEINSIKLTASKLNLEKGKSSTLTASILPDNATIGTDITWKSSNTKVASVSANGKVTAMAKGTANITATTESGKTASCTVTVTEKAAVAKVTSPSTPQKFKAKAKKKKAKLTWKKASDAKKYQIAYKQKGAKKWKTKTIASSKTSVTIKKLKAKKKYQFKIRSYKLDGKKKLYSKWSGVKTIKIKK